MRGLPLLLLALLLTGCGKQADPVAPAMGLPRDSATPSDEHLLAQFELRLDPGTLAADLTPVRAANAQPPQAYQYDLDIENFLTPETLRISGVGLTAAGDVEVEFTHRHPFPAPNFGLPISGTNRCDLGYTGRLLVITEAPAQDFFDSTVSLDPTLVVGADGYMNPGDLLATPETSAATVFPYVLLVDEAKNNRIGVSNGSNPTGTYNPAAGGWQRGNIGAGNTGWTGYDYLHQGQGVRNTFTLSRSALEAAGYSVQLAIMIRYTDPRGGTLPAFRMPPTTPDLTWFAYRLPHAALECSVIEPQPMQFHSGPNAIAPLRVNVRDWDVGAPVAQDSTLGDEPNVSAVMPDGNLIPDVYFDCFPVLSNWTRLTPDPDFSGSGLPGNELVYAKFLTNAKNAAVGTYTGVLRVDDLESQNSRFYAYGVDPQTLVPSISRDLPLSYFQTVDVRIGESVPAVVAVTPSGTIGEVGTPIAFGAETTNFPTTYAWTFGAGTTPPTASGPAPVVTLATAGTYTGSLVVSNGAGASAPFSFEYTVDPTSDLAPEVLWVSPTGEVGDPDEFVEFSASASRFPTSWSWDFGGGAFPDTATDPSPEVALGAEGLYTGTVTATNGFGPSASFEFTYRVGPPPVTGPTWNVHALNDLPSRGRPRPVVYNDRLVVLYVGDDGGPGQISLQISHTEESEPNSSGDWDSFELAQFSSDIWTDHDLTAYGPRLGVRYTDGTGNARIGRFAVSTNGSPWSAADWSFHDLPGTTGIAGGDILDHEGVPVIVFAPNLNGARTVRFLRSAVSAPAGPGDWSSHVVESAGESRIVSAIYHQGHFYVSYLHASPEECRIARSIDGLPASAAGWTSYSLASGPYRPSPFAVFGDRLALKVAHRDTYDPRIYRALATDPMGASDWDWVPMFTAGEQLYNYGERYLLFHDNEDIHNPDCEASRALVVDPNAALDWQTLAVDESGNGLGRESDGLSFGGFWVFFPDTTGALDTLKVGYLQDSW